MSAVLASTASTRVSASSGTVVGRGVNTDRQAASISAAVSKRAAASRASAVVKNLWSPGAALGSNIAGVIVASSCTDAGSLNPSP